jgi:alpha-tubulin suppressor-like RCC1 family protein
MWNVVKKLIRAFPISLVFLCFFLSSCRKDQTNTPAVVKPVITITSQPSNQTAASGSASFSVSASATESASLSYQWQKQESGAGSFSNVSGGTSSTLNLSSLTNAADNGDVYRVVVNATGGAVDVVSNAVTLTVNAATSGGGGSVGSTTVSYTSNVCLVSGPGIMGTVNVNYSVSQQVCESAGMIWSGPQGQLGSCGKAYSANSCNEYYATSLVNGLDVTTTNLSGACPDEVMTAASLTIDQASCISLAQTYASSYPNLTFNWAPLTVTTKSNLFDTGINTHGQLGDGTTTLVNKFKAVGSHTDLSFMSAGASHALAIRNGQLYAWGRNDSGQLGDGTSIDRYSPVQIGSATTWTTVSAGLNYSLGIHDGKLYAWGTNFAGQLGDGTTTSRLSPVQVGFASDWTAVSTGEYHTLGIRGGKLYAWGYNPNGQLGTGSVSSDSNDCVLTPVQIGTDSDWTHVSAGIYHSIGIRSGMLYAWGSNVFGSGGSGDALTPTRVGSASSWTAISASNSFSLAVKDGKLYAWGDNYYGQLGDGTHTFRSSPVQIGSDSTWSAISAGQVFSLGINNGKLYAWGDNTDSQFGNGTGTSSNSPTQIGNRSDWFFVNASKGQYGFSYALVNPMGSCSYPICGTTGNGCYDNQAAIAAGHACLIDGTQVDYVNAGKGSAPGLQPFKIWKDHSSSKVLKATGHWESQTDWQKTLSRSGLEFTSTPFTNYTIISGRVCPTNAFNDYSHMTETGQCLYTSIAFEYGGAYGPFTLNYYSNGTLGEDYLADWNASGSGNGTGPSWYEGNVKPCADQGSRLPTLYETNVTGIDPYYYFPPTDANPTFGGNGVPSNGYSGNSAWTASASQVGTSFYWVWSGNGLAAEAGSNGTQEFSVICVLPSGR